MNKRFTFGGINRKVSDYDNGGATEELINLRPDGRGSFHPVRGKAAADTLSAGSTALTFLCRHDWGGGVNRIYVSNTGTLLYSSGSSTTKNPITSTSAYTTTAADVCVIGNMLVASDTNRGVLHVFEVSGTDGTYTEKTVTAPVLTASMDDGGSFVEVSDSTQIHDASYWDADLEPSAKLFDLIEDRLRVLRAKNGNLCFGMVLVALQYRLRDGRAWFTERIMPYAVQLSSNYTYGSLSCPIYPDATITVTDRGAALSVEISASSWDNDMVEAVDVYCTQPVTRRGSAVDPVVSTLNRTVGFRYSVKTLAELMDGQGLFHRVGSVTREAALAGASVPLFFGDELEASPLMDVDAGYAVHTGSLMAYNGRAHVYSGRNNVHPCTTTGAKLTTASGTISTAYIKISSNGAAAVMKSTSADIPNGAGVLIYPDARCSAIATGSGANNGVVMHASKRYNFAWGDVSDTTTLVTSNSAFVSYPETNAVNVSRQNMPFAFDPANSYAIPSKVRLMVPSVVPISEYQAGLYPIHIFTDVGVFAMQQGDGGTLYSSVTPVSEYTADSNVISTPYGKIFCARGGLYLLNGTHTELLSAVMNGGPHMEVYADSTQTSYLGGTTYFSTIPFEEFCANGTNTRCTVAFDPLHMEVIVSNSGKTYSYVLSFATKLWHKIVGTFEGTREMDLAVSGSYLMDMNTDDSTVKAADMWMLTRPFFIDEMQYTHIDRLCTECRTSLAPLSVWQGAPLYGQVKLSLFGSNNLYEWTLIAADVKQGSATTTYVSQIRPERPHRSWKYYALGVYGYQLPVKNGTATTGDIVSPAQIGSLIVSYHTSRRNIG